MTKETHSSGGYLLTALTFSSFASLYLENYSILYKLILFSICFGFANLGALLPDLDTRKSYISKKWPYLSKFISKRCKHRGFTHSLLFLIILAEILKIIILIGENNIILICASYGIFSGYVSHIILDAFTYEGVDLFFPLGFNLKLSRLKTSSKSEKHVYRILKFISINLILYNLYMLLQLKL
ncbi:metal-dependent hydrolase [Paraclostridium sordellii]|uniref:metal-dependent hydrolase n=1 Tax=Paraclostridium sordellii TaxID=1505 RepID=UPI0005E5E301|nr:metal-dependent hydrolase [Paeniclostridium sordellii]CEO22068.1 metal-dependent hydrolase [[Clostridium] sordellii] [Paeniclostridium sordellii]